MDRKLLKGLKSKQIVLFPTLALSCEGERTMPWCPKNCNTLSSKPGHKNFIELLNSKQLTHLARFIKKQIKDLSSFDDVAGDGIRTEGNQFVQFVHDDAGLELQRAGPEAENRAAIKLPSELDEAGTNFRVGGCGKWSPVKAATETDSICLGINMLIETDFETHETLLFHLVSLCFSQFLHSDSNYLDAAVPWTTTSIEYVIAIYRSGSSVFMSALLGAGRSCRLAVRCEINVHESEKFHKPVRTSQQIPQNFGASAYAHILHRWTASDCGTGLPGTLWRWLRDQRIVSSGDVGMASLEISGFAERWAWWH